MAMTKTIENINLDTWFTERELAWKPDHFIDCTTPATGETRSWILEKRHGRFVITPDFCPAFEDSREAMFYELTWG